MKRPLLLLLALLVISTGSCFLTYSALAQIITKSVGTPKCQAFNDASGDHCYQLKCDATPDSYANYDKCDDKAINASLDGVQLCETPPNAGTITTPIACRTSAPTSVFYT